MVGAVAERDQGQGKKTASLKNKEEKDRRASFPEMREAQEESVD